MEAHARNNAWKILQECMQENPGNLQKLSRPKRCSSAKRYTDWEGDRTDETGEADEFG